MLPGLSGHLVRPTPLPHPHATALRAHGKQHACHPGLLMGLHLASSPNCRKAGSELATQDALSNWMALQAGSNCRTQDSVGSVGEGVVTLWHGLSAV